MSSCSTRPLASISSRCSASSSSSSSSALAPSAAYLLQARSLSSGPSKSKEDRTAQIAKYQQQRQAQLKEQQILNQKQATTITASKSSDVHLHGTSGKFAQGLFNAAKATNTLDQVAADFEKFLQLWNTHETFAQTMANPVWTYEQQSAVMAAACKHLKLSELMTRTLLTIVQLKKSELISNLARNFAQLLAADRKEAHGVITSASPLTEDQYKRIAQKMRGLVSADEKLIVAREVNPKLLGGFKIRIGFLEQDLSVSSQISQMHKALQQAFASHRS